MQLSKGISCHTQFLSSIQILLNYIQSGDYSSAISETQKLHTLLSTRQLPGSELPSMLAYIRSTLHIGLEGITNIHEDDFLKLFQKYPLHRSQPLNQYFTELNAFIEELPSVIIKDSGISNTIQQVAEYIRQNFVDANLSAGLVADTFHISLPWLSIHFKEEMGMGFLDFLHNCRLNNAKIYLKESSMNIRDIAIACGYTNSATFSRAFSRYEGITPSQYRQTVASSKE